MKNICFFNSTKFWGGGEKLILEYALEFRKKAYNVLILATKNSELWKQAKKHNLEIYPAKVSNLSIFNPFAIQKLKKFYQQFNIDTVIFTTSQDMKVGSISAKKAGVKRIVYLRGLAVPVKASFINKKVYGSYLTHIISNSEETKRMILKNLDKNIPAGKVKTIYHGIDLQDFSSSQTLKFIEEKKHGIVLGNAGRLTEQKGQMDLISIAKILREKNIDFTIFIAGTGDLQLKLEVDIAKNNLENYVYLIGFVKDMNVFMNSLDVFILTSAWEGFGYVLVEAMAFKKPIVAYKITSNPEIVSNNETGFLVPFKDYEKFAEKIIELSKSIELRNKMGEAGYERLKENFQLSDRISELESYLLNS